RHYRRGLRVLGVNVDSELEPMQQAKRELRLRFPNAHDPERTLVRRWGARTIPMLWVIDGDGVVRHVQGGYEPGDERVLERIVRGLLPPEPTPDAGISDAGLSDAGLQDAGAPETPAPDRAGQASSAPRTPTRPPASQPAALEAPPPAAPAARTNRAAGLCTITRSTPSPLAAITLLAFALLLSARRP
ncbi:MAG TPA: hypothetical protein DEF51_52770, partial [Myxococcales bacterium]|nr:hypothetical protein [Myxococcales bacterium]